MTNDSQHDLATAVAVNLPYLRRYARALTGSQEMGDELAASTLEKMLADDRPDIPSEGHAAKVGLFRVFHTVWQTSGAPTGSADSALSARAQKNMANLTPNTREALLLYAIEAFSPDEIGSILGVREEEAEELISIARREVEDAVAGQVMVIEDEAIIALDIAAIVQEDRHTITGIARTRDEAVALAEKRKPDLILADIQLADNSSGIDAVADILARFEDIPVIFITAFPERLLTGQRHEPAFVITKPFTEDQVRYAVGQAMFFASTETLAA